MSLNTDPIKGWEIRPSTGKHFDFLDGLRGIAILMVVSTHTFYVNPQAGSVMQAVGGLLSTGVMGVPIFFVLSGFLISYPFFLKRANQAGFWHLEGYPRRRIGKILPPFYLSIIIFTFYYLVRYGDPHCLLISAKYALGLPNFFPTPTLLYTSVYWSLIIEVHFYIVLPFLFYLTRGLGLHQTVAIIAVILFFVPFIVRQFTWPWYDQSQASVNFHVNRLPCSLDYFAWGVLFAGIHASFLNTGNKLKKLALLGYVGMVSMAATCSIFAFCIIHYNILVFPIRLSVEAYHFLPGISVFLILFFAFDPVCLGARFLAQPWLRFVGIVSYEWFLFHEPVVILVAETMGQTKGSAISYLIKTVLPLALTFIASVAIYRYFSLPLMNLIRGKTRRKKTLTPTLIVAD